MEKQFYRTFIALPLKAGEDILQVREELMHALRGERISWVDPDKYHVTIRFLGETEIQEVERIRGLFQEEWLELKAASIGVSGFRSFGPYKHPRVIFAAFEQEEWFRELKEAVDLSLADLGWPREERKFTAHLTLARIRSMKDSSSFHAFMNGFRDRSCSELDFDRVVYYRSILGENGPEYRKLSEILLERE